jgi:plasmid stabilization system protein ParE
MSESYSVIITPEAQSDISKIIHYIAGELKAPQAAVNLNDLFLKSIKDLAVFPKRNKVIDEEPWGSEKIRKLIVKNYFFYYNVNDLTRTISIIAVIYAGMDQTKQINKRSKTK